MWDYEIKEIVDCSKTEVRMKIQENNRPKVSIEKFLWVYADGKSSR